MIGDPSAPVIAEQAPSSFLNHQRGRRFKRGGKGGSLHRQAQRGRPRPPDHKIAHEDVGSSPGGRRLPAERAFFPLGHSENERLRREDEESHLERPHNPHSFASHKPFDTYLRSTADRTDGTDFHG
jgi:hypothetical protein